MGGKRTKEAAEVSKAIGSRVRALRIGAGMSQTALGEVLGVSFQQIQKYESGVNRIGAPQLAVLTKTLRCSVSDILGVAGRDNAESGELMAFIATRDGQDLARAYMAMSPARRLAVIGLIRDLGA